MSMCPVCPDEKLVQVEQDDVCAQSCGRCHGTWISAAALQRRVNLETAPEADQAGAGGSGVADLAATASAADTKGTLYCVICRQAMVKGRFHSKIPVQVDRCERCNYLWLDAGEQGLLLALYRELLSTHESAGTDGVAMAQMQARHDQLEQLRKQRLEAAPITYSSGGGGASGIGAEIAGNVAMLVLQIVVDLLIPGPSYRRW